MAHPSIGIIHTQLPENVSAEGCDPVRRECFLPSWPLSDSKVQRYDA